MIIYLMLPYLNRKVEVFGLDLENLVKKLYNDVKLEVVFQTANDIGRCFPFKGGHSKHMQSCGVYDLRSSDCNADYIRKTSRQVKRRFEEQYETYDSACFDHEKTYNHKIDYKNFKILKF